MPDKRNDQITSSPKEENADSQKPTVQVRLLDEYFIIYLILLILFFY